MKSPAKLTKSQNACGCSAVGGTRPFCRTSNGFLTFFFSRDVDPQDSCRKAWLIFHVFFTFEMLLWSTRRSIFWRNVCVGQGKLLYLTCRFLWFLQKVRVAPVALRIRCLQKSIEIVHVLKIQWKPMILHAFRVDFVSDRLRSFWSRLGAFASWCWIATAILVSRNRFGRFCFNVFGVQRSV